MIKTLATFVFAGFMAFASVADATQIRAIYKLFDAKGAFDGFGVVTSIANLDGTDRILELRRSNLPATVRNGTAAEIQTYINEWLATNLAGHPTKCQVRVWSSSPLNIDVICSDQPIPANAFDPIE